MKEFTRKNLVSMLSLIVSALFILGGAVNVGFTGFFWATPFVLIFLFLLTEYKRPHKIILLLGMTLLCLFFLWDKPRNTLIYPHLGAEIEVSPGWFYARTTDSEHYILVSPGNASLWQHEAHRSIVVGVLMIEEPLNLQLDRVEVSHPDFGVSLKLVFLDSNEVSYSIFPTTLTSGIESGDIKSVELEGISNYQSKWSEYLGYLMYWPMLPTMVLGLFSSI